MKKILRVLLIICITALEFSLYAEGAPEEAEEHKASPVESLEDALGPDYTPVRQGSRRKSKGRKHRNRKSRSRRRVRCRRR